jgi:geranylgeranyl reductase family protein
MTSSGYSDVAVIGAGPSGAWAAHLLARRGARVRLYDPSHPREKPCGGGVTGRALSIVASAVPLDRLPAVRIRRATFHGGPSGTTAHVALPAVNAAHTGDALVVASRTDFDALLLEAAREAGAELVAARVTAVARENGHFLVRTRAGHADRARLVVGADGASSLVRRSMARRFDRHQLSIATGFFAHGVTGDDIAIEMTADPPGYLWSFPRPDHLAIGICAQADAGTTADALRSMASRWIAERGIADGARLTPYCWPIPSLSAADFEALEVSGPGWLLAGDAAGLVDPITREGIFFALRSGQLAADAISAGGMQPDREYADRLHAEILVELACAARFKAGFFRPRFNRLFLQAINRSARIRAVVADLVAGAQSYRGLKSRLARTFELGLGWQAIRPADLADLLARNTSSSRK